MSNETKTQFRCIIMGAAGRDFHDAQTFFKEHPEFRICAFTATQIPFIDTRHFPREFMGSHYDQDIPIYPEEKLDWVIQHYNIDMVFLAYSDLSHQEVMHKASKVQACGAMFALAGPKQTQLTSKLPTIAVTAVRTGTGKSPVTQAIARHLRSLGKRVAVIRHPMPYGDLRKQRVQRFSSHADLDLHQCTIEEREEYEPYIEQGLTIWAGVDYNAILKAAETESDVVLWDGGNNDYPFIKPTLWITLVDPLRPGHEVGYYPGETNLRAAHVVVISKVRAAQQQALNQVRNTIKEINPTASVLEADLVVSADHPELIQNRRVLVVEDGPTTTHGGMAWGAGVIAAQKFQASALIDPHPFAVGSIKTTIDKYRHLHNILPALGYSEEQLKDLEQTIAQSDADVVVDASPSRLQRVIRIQKPVVRVQYDFEQLTGPSLLEMVNRVVSGLPPHA